MSTLAWVGLSAAMAATAFAVLGLRLGHPQHRKIAIGVWVASWIPLGVSVAQHRAEIQARADVLESALQGHELHLGFVVILLLVGYLVRVAFPSESGVVPELDEAELAAAVDVDLAQLAYLLDKVERVTEAVTESGIETTEGKGLSAEDDERLRTLWARFVETAFELEILKARYRAFYSVNPITRPLVHARCFLVAYGAYVAEYRAGMLLTHWIGDDDTLQTALNEANPRFDLPADTLLRMKRRSVHPDTIVRLNAGRAYLKLMKDRLSEERVYPRVRGYLRDVDDMLESNPDVFIDNPLDYLERRAFDLWFPIQKNLTVGISALHLPLRDHFVGPEELQAAAARLEPGDILLARREWHLTNLGIPGYWTHAALYCGTLEAMDAYFEGVPELEGARASEYLRAEDPAAHARLSSPDEAGYAMAVMEAVTAGVKVSSLEKAGSSDALGVVRPNVGRFDKLRAILEASRHLGKPYDYNFDLATDNELVCSELIYKAYQRIDGVDLEPEELNGRLLLSPNAICEKFDAEYDAPGRQLEHALFLDGVDVGHVEDRGAAELRQSWRRPKWHILLVGAEDEDDDEDHADETSRRPAVGPLD